MVDILLSTYNSNKFLARQLDSIFEQIYTDWQLLIRDDGSSDNTIDIINSYIAKFPSKIRLLQSNENVGVTQSFNILLQSSKSPYVMFCDHDDVWLPNKIIDELKCMHMAEEKYGNQYPLLVFSDLEVVDCTLQHIHHSFFQYSKLPPTDFRLERFLFYFNWIPGCTMLFNRKLAENAGKIPAQAMWHDEWLVLLTIMYGQLVFCPEHVIMYRQHSNNLSGGAINKKWFNWFITLWNVKRRRTEFRRRLQQFDAFTQQYCHSLPAKELTILNLWSRLPSSTWWQRGWIIFRCGRGKISIWRMLVLWLIS